MVGLENTISKGAEKQRACLGCTGLTAGGERSSAKSNGSLAKETVLSPSSPQTRKTTSRHLPVAGKAEVWVLENILTRKRNEAGSRVLEKVGTLVLEGL